MNDKDADYQPTIGIECHVQLSTKTKLFAPVDNNARDAEPNSKVSVICLGYPGTLPVLNQKAVELAVRAGFALNSKINLYSTFDRKHYFYPDLPKGYQITQFSNPIIGEGLIEFPIGNETKKVRITRAHLEEDAGKSSHPSGADYTLVDLNRAGTPLLEIVSEPDIKSAIEARAYAKELYLRVKYAGVSDADLYHGNMRFDVNVSVSKSGSNKLGVRAEIKNLNSFKSVQRATEYEIKRQIEILKKGEIVVQETRGFDEDKGRTFSQRGKEEAHDYRYFPDPDIPPISLTEQQIKEIKESAYKPLTEIRASLRKMGLDFSSVDKILDDPKIAIFINRIGSSNQNEAKKIATWIVNSKIKIDGDKLEENSDNLLSLVSMVEKGELNSTAAKDVFRLVLEKSSSPEKIAQEMNLTQNNDENAVEQIVDKIINDNPKAVEEVRSGEMKVIGYLVGQAMKESKGGANPGMIQQLIRKKLL